MRGSYQSKCKKIDLASVRRAFSLGLSLQAVADRLGVSKSSVARLVATDWQEAYLSGIADRQLALKEV